MLKDKKLGNETFSEAIKRLMSEWTITDYGGERSDEEIEYHKKILDEMDQDSTEDVEKTLQKIRVDIQ